MTTTHTQYSTQHGEVLLPSTMRLLSPLRIPWQCASYSPSPAFPRLAAWPHDHRPPVPAARRRCWGRRSPGRRQAPPARERERERAEGWRPGIGAVEAVVDGSASAVERTQKRQQPSRRSACSRRSPYSMGPSPSPSICGSEPKPTRGALRILISLRK